MPLLTPWFPSPPSHLLPIPHHLSLFLPSTAEHTLFPPVPPQHGPTRCWTQLVEDKELQLLSCKNPSCASLDDYPHSRCRKNIQTACFGASHAATQPRLESNLYPERSQARGLFMCGKSSKATQCNIYFIIYYSWRPDWSAGQAWNEKKQHNGNIQQAFSRVLHVGGWCSSVHIMPVKWVCLSWRNNDIYIYSI